jgi:hypothetical protein
MEYFNLITVFQFNYNSLSSCLVTIWFLLRIQKHCQNKIKYISNSSFITNRVLKYSFIVLNEIIHANLLVQEQRPWNNLVLSGHPNLPLCSTDGWQETCTVCISFLESAWLHLASEHKDFCDVCGRLGFGLWPRDQLFWVQYFIFFLWLLQVNANTASYWSPIYIFSTSLVTEYLDWCYLAALLTA